MKRIHWYACNTKYRVTNGLRNQILRCISEGKSLLLLGEETVSSAMAERIHTSIPIYGREHLM